MNYSIGLHIYRDTDIKVIVHIIEGSGRKFPTLNIEGATLFFNDDTIDQTIKALQKLKRQYKKAQEG